MLADLNETLSNCTRPFRSGRRSPPCRLMAGRLSRISNTARVCKDDQVSDCDLLICTSIVCTDGFHEVAEQAAQASKRETDSQRVQHIARQHACRNKTGNQQSQQCNNTHQESCGRPAPAARHTTAPASVPQIASSPPGTRLWDKPLHRWRPLQSRQRMLHLREVKSEQPASDEWTELQLTVYANFLAELVRLRDALRVEVDLIRLAEERPHCANLKNALTVGRELNEVTATCEIDSSATSVARASASCVFWLSSRSFMPSDAHESRTRLNETNCSHWRAEIATIGTTELQPVRASKRVTG